LLQICNAKRWLTPDSMACLLARLAGKLLELNLFNVLARNHHEADVARRHVHNGRVSGRRRRQRGRGSRSLHSKYAVLVGKVEDDVAVLCRSVSAAEASLEPTESVHRNSPTNMRVSAMVMRSDLFSSDLRYATAEDGSATAVVAIVASTPCSEPMVWRWSNVVVFDVEFSNDSAKMRR
jgi:hypothetical protein